MMLKHSRLLSLVMALSCATLLAYASPTAARPTTQYTNPYSGATWNNSFSRIMDMTRTWNQNLWDAQRRVQAVTDQTAAMGNRSGGAAATQPLPPPMRQFPITATDFQPTANRLVPDGLANAMPNLTLEQKQGVRELYYQFLAAFEKAARKNNLANAFAFTISVSLEVVNGNEVPQAEIDRLTIFYNNALASTPQFNALPPQHKQILYESLILTGGTIGFLHLLGERQNDAVMRSQANGMAQLVLRQLAGIQQ